MKKKITNLVNKITRLLTIRKHLRDSDRKLTCNIWWSAVPNPATLLFKDFLNLYLEDKVPESDSITRCRRKVQEERKDLRGDSWDKRHGLEKVVKNELKNMKFKG